jgi:hypothetical protein
VLVAYAPRDARIDLEPILQSGLLWFEQDGDNLGAPNTYRWLEDHCPDSSGLS